MPLRFELLVGANSPTFRSKVQETVEQALAKDHEVCLIDFSAALDLFIEDWKGTEVENFSYHVPESFAEAAELLEWMVQQKVRLIVLYWPRVAEPLDVEHPWKELFLKIRKAKSWTRVLVADIVINFEDFDPKGPWARYAKKKTFLEELRTQYF